MSTLKAVRGTRDLLPPETALWNRIEATARSVFARYNFGEIRTPIFEDTSLFARGVGEETDIVIPAAIDSVTIWHLSENAFARTNIVRVEISYGIDCIRNNTFANCVNLREITIPRSVIHIDKNAFNGCSDFKIICEPNSYAYYYAVLYDIPYTFM